MSYTISMVNGDFDYDSYGRVRTVSGTNKSAQDLGEMLQSRFDSSRGYGTNLEVGHIGYLDQSAWIKSELQATVTRFQTIQKKSGTSDRNELVSGVKSIAVTTDGWGAYTWNLQVTVGTGATVTSYNGVLGRRKTALLNSSPTNQGNTTGTYTPELTSDETLAHAQQRVTSTADWGTSQAGFVWKSPELPIPVAVITALVTLASLAAPSAITIKPSVPATPKPVSYVSFVIDAKEVMVSTLSPYTVVIPNIKSGTTIIYMYAHSADNKVVGTGSVEVTLN